MGTTDNHDQAKINPRRGRDALRVLIFSAIFIGIYVILSYVIGACPPVLTVFPLILALVSGILYELLMDKLISHTGIIIPTFLLSLFLFLAVPYGLMFFLPVIGAAIGQILYDFLREKKPWIEMICVALPGLGWALGQYIPFASMQDILQVMYADAKSSAIVGPTMAAMSAPIAVLLIVLTVVCSLAGYWIGKKLLAKRHAAAEH